MSPVFIEVRANEYTGREANPNVPWSVDELIADAVACAEAGASVYHFHGRDPSTGAPVWDADTLGAVIVGVREACDLILMPTLGASTVPDPHARLAPVLELAADAATRPELAPIDLGSFNIDPYDPATGAFGNPDIVYITPLRALREMVAASAEAGMKPMGALWTVGSARLLAAFLDTGDMAAPAYGEVTLSDSWLSGHPATVDGIDAMTRFLPDDGRAVWGCLAYGADLRPLAPEVIARGGHLIAGLGDYPYLELGTPTNADVVAALAGCIADSGAELATVGKTRAMLGLAPAS
ncbi:3-keto-5-aminohexanoate cleavage protein [Candidatus Poriferisocius sp.]|uniref:3-keto-5-aminohexanoate cleavage protein n=1 Tax=Candidatus Poriferisocius sp. TaxID=3101276 RepID=UPI003B02A73E